MPTAQLQAHLRNVTERLDLVTVELLSDDSGARKHLMAERRFLLADLARTCKTLERSKSRARSILAFPKSLSLVK